jgi:hypothetical protein
MTRIPGKKPVTVLKSPGFALFRIVTGFFPGILVIKLDSVENGVHL